MSVVNPTSSVSRAHKTTARPGFSFSAPLPLHLAFKEIWRNKGRFFLIAVVVALITLLVLFTAGLAEGLGLGNREFLERVNADLIVYSDKSELLIPGSRISEARVRDLRQIDGVQDVGAIAWASVAVLPLGKDAVKVALGGVLVGEPGEPPVVQGRQLDFKRGMEAVIDQSTATRTGLRVGDVIVIRSIVGSKEKLYDLVVAGIARSNQYSLQPTVFVPSLTFEKIRPRASELTVEPGSSTPPVTFNIALIRLNNPADKVAMAKAIETAIAKSKSIVGENDGVLVVQKQKAWENTPGYSAQQSTLSLQRVFTLLIGLLVVGSFFRIQAAQKIAQVGVLKAIGTASWKIGAASLLQIFVVNAFGVALGGVLTYGLTLGLPPVVPIRFDGNDVATTIGLLLVIGPLGGLVAVRALLQAEPLKALGLAS